MPKLSDFKRIKHIQCRWPDTEETLNLWIKPDEFTGAKLGVLESRIDEAEKGDASSQLFLCTFLSEMLDRWDLEDEHGNTIPTTPESLFENIPITLTSALLDSVRKAINPDPQKPES
jgi:hypothetical protein